MQMDDQVVVVVDFVEVPVTESESVAIGMLVVLLKIVFAVVVVVAVVEAEVVLLVKRIAFVVHSELDVVVVVVLAIENVAAFEQ